MWLKQDILFELEAHRDADLSGQQLAERFGVSRSAVWKAVNTLKEEGYHILSGPNKGYRLAQDSDLLSAEGIRGCLAPEYRDLPIYFYREIDSTNNEAKRLAANGLGTPALLVAERQTAGRGRNGRAFYSPDRTGIYMTLVLHPEAQLSHSLSITTMAAVAVVRAVEALTDARPQIKWVNDVYLGDRKICGILTEAVTGFESGMVHSLIVGIGLNVSTQDFPEGISSVAASLNPSGLLRSRLAAEIASQLLHLARDLSDRAYMAEYRAHCMVLGKPIRCISPSDSFEALALGVDDEGGLLIRRADGTEDILRTGEISIRLTT